MNKVPTSLITAIRMIVLILIAVILVACEPVQTQVVEPDHSPPQLLTSASPEGAMFLDVCTHMMSYPPDLMPDEMGFMLIHEDGSEVNVIVTARRRASGEEGLFGEDLAAHVYERYFGFTGFEVEFERTPVTNYLNETVDGFVADRVDENGQHIRLMVVIQPDFLLMDMVSDDVVYEIIARAPEEKWEEWEPGFDIIFQTFHPVMCGGV